MMTVVVYIGLANVSGIFGVKPPYEGSERHACPCSDEYVSY